MQQSPQILRSYGDTDFITGLRAIAATMVVMIHTNALNDFGVVGQAVTSAGKYGVDVFFVISGFTIAKTFTQARDYRSYLTRRIMRIVPLYWFVISIAMVLWLSGLFSMPYWMQTFGAQPDLYNFLMHLGMVSYLDYRIANSLLGVEWTIPIEVFWYVCLPFVIRFGETVLKTIGVILALLILTEIMSHIAREALGTSRLIGWSPIAHGHLFFIGVLAYHLRARFLSKTPQYIRFFILGAVAIFILSLTLDFSGRSEALALCTATLIACVTPSRASWLTKFLTVRPLLFLGSISYSIYLIHILVGHVLDDLGVLPTSGIGKFLLVYSITTALSTITYLMIEKPTNQAGLHMIRSTK